MGEGRQGSAWEVASSCDWSNWQEASVFHLDLFQEELEGSHEMAAGVPLNSSPATTETRDPRKQSRGSDSHSLAIKVTLSLLPYLMANRPSQLETWGQVDKDHLGTQFRGCLPHPPASLTDPLSVQVAGGHPLTSGKSCLYSILWDKSYYF